MRVIIATSFPREDDAPTGGVESVSVNLVDALARREELEVHVATMDRECRAPSVSAFGRASIHRLPWDRRRLLWHALRGGGETLRRHVESLAPDVIHAHDYYGIMVRGLRTPKVFTVHGFIHADTRHSRGMGARLRSRLWRMAEWRAWRDQDHIISISPYVREYLSGKVPGVIHDIENPVDREFFTVERRGLTAGRIICLGVICRRKNAIGLLEGFRAALTSGAHLDLRFAGPFEEKVYEEQVRTLVRSRGLEPHVTFLGPVPRKGILEELTQATALALTSLEEGAPMVIAEAMAAGLPVVASNRCGMPYMVRHGETGYLVDPGNVQDIGARLSALARDPELNERMGNAARRFAEDRFHPDRVADRTMEVYREALT